jgi:hypothetical protein
MIFPVPSQFRVVQGFAAIATFDDTLSEDPVKYSQQYPNNAINNPINTMFPQL